MEDKINEWSDFLLANGLTLLAAIAIFVIGRIVVKWVTDTTQKVMAKNNVEPTLSNFLKNLLNVAGMAFVILAALSKLGVQTASFVAVLGAAGLAVGLALQGSLSNFAAGVMIILFRPYAADDFIKAGGTMGTVKEVQIFNTILSTPDNVCVILPNAQALSSEIMNYSKNPTRRVDLVIGVSYGDDILKVKQLLEQTVKADERVLEDPAPVVAVSELADSSVNFVVRPWVKKEDYWGAYWGLTEKIKLELEKNGFTIPFPQQDVYIQSLPQTTAAGSSAGTNI